VHAAVCKPDFYIPVLRRKSFPFLKGRKWLPQTSEDAQIRASRRKSTNDQSRKIEAERGRPDTLDLMLLVEIDVVVCESSRRGN
jgi:hypothetical protein